MKSSAFWDSLKPGVVAEITWEDARGCAQGWISIKEARETETVLISSVGWVVRRARKDISIAAHVASDGGGVMGMSTIPRSAVRGGRFLFKPPKIA